jgi:hypothetical protein
MSKSLFCTPWYFPFILESLTYPCPFMLLTSSLCFSNAFIYLSKRSFLDVSCTLKNSRNYSSTFIGLVDKSTYLKIRVICLWWHLYQEYNQV